MGHRQLYVQDSVAEDDNALIPLNYEGDVSPAQAEEMELDPGIFLDDEWAL